MTTEDIREAKRETVRFLKSVINFESRLRTDKYFQDYWHLTGGKETAALKRASLDLTRALSRMRGNR